MAGKEGIREVGCWRKEVDSKLDRVQSMLFGADAAIEKGDYSRAQVMCLALIGFLDSQSNNNSDFILPIRRQALSLLARAKSHLIPISDRQAFEQAGREPGCIFTKHNKNNIIEFHKILKQSKFPPPLVQPSTTPNQLNTSLYANKNTLNFTNSDVVANKIRPEEPERVSAAIKWPCRQTVSPRNEILKSPQPDVNASTNGFVTAKTKLEMDAKRKRGLTGSPTASFSPQDDAGTNKAYGARSYGISRRGGVRGNFVPPIKSSGNSTANVIPRNVGKGDDAMDDSTRKCLELLCGPDGEIPEKLRNLEPRLIEHISNEIMDRDPNVRWDDIAGLEHAKKCVTEMVIWPLLRPDIFKGCRSPGRGLLLFGPPGTGKTMIGKAIAGEAKATFFYISASSLTSKWIGEGEKLVRALFGVASCRQPAVIFVDEIDSLLSQRKSEGEHESSRRLKTQFLIEMESFDGGNEQILLIGATNRPQELDEAARRRLTKRLYIPLPTAEARAWIIKNLLEKDGLFNLSREEIDTICKMTEGYSGSDMKNLVKDASMGPLREALSQGIEITKLKKEDLGPVHVQDFEKSLQEVRPSVSLNELGVYERWNEQFGSLSL